MSIFTPSLFDGIADADLQIAYSRFTVVSVNPGDVLMEEGDVDPSLVIVISGTVEIRTGQTVLGTATAGDLVGEMAVFTGQVRTATVEALEACQLWLLDQGAYRWLRDIGNPVAAAIEAHALELLAGRLRTCSSRIASLSEGTPAEHLRPPQGFFDAVRKLFGGGGEVSPADVDKVAVLRTSPLFADATQDELLLVAEHFQLVGADAGHRVIVEGDVGDRMYVVATGTVDVVVSTGEERMQELAVLDPGEAFGICSLMDDRHRRMASCIARERSTLLYLDKLTFIEVVKGGTPASSAMRVALIRALGDQLAFANGQLAMLAMQGETEGELATLCRAGAALEAHGHYMDGSGLGAH